MEKTIQRIHRTLPKKVRFLYLCILIASTLYGSLWGLAEPFNPDNPCLPYILVGLSLLGIAFYFFADYLINRYWFVKFPEIVRANEIEEILEKYLKVLHEVEEKKDIFKLSLLKWRMETELSKIRDIENGHWIFYALPRYGYLRYIFRSIIKSLEKGDIYETLSNLDFWSLDKYGLEVEFLAENLEAVDRGVIIRRIIIVDKAIFNPITDELKKELDNLTAILNNFKRSSEGYQSEAFEKIELYFYLSDNYEQDASAPVPFAIISNKEKNLSMAVEPYEKGADKAPEIKVSFSEKSNGGMYKASQSRFRNLYGRRKEFLSLSEMIAKLDALPATTKNSLGKTTKIAHISTKRK